MSSVVVLPATEEHARQMAPHMRPEDAAEAFASHGLAPLPALLAAMGMSHFTKTTLLGDEVAAMYGVVPLDILAGTASAWMLTGPAVDRHPVTFLRWTKDEFSRLRQDWPVIFNFVDARYQKSVRWLEWLGFDVWPPEPYGATGIPFRPISIGGDAWLS